MLQRTQEGAHPISRAKFSLNAESFYVMIALEGLKNLKNVKPENGRAIFHNRCKLPEEQRRGVCLPAMMQ